MRPGGKRREEIAGIMRNNPGIQFREIMRRTGMKSGVSSHHPYKIEKSGTVAVERSPGRTHCYPREVTGLESRTVKALRRGTHSGIITALMTNRGGLAFCGLAGSASRAPSTVPQCMRQLENDGIVGSRVTNRIKTHSLADRERWAAP